MNTERERFEEIYEKIRLAVDHDNRHMYTDNPYRYRTQGMVMAWEMYQFQAATIADLQQQLTEALEIIELKITEQGYTSAHDRRLQEVLGGG